MATSVYVASGDADSGKSAVALALFDQLVRRSPRVAAFRPVVRRAPDGGTSGDPVVDLLRPRSPLELPYEASVGVTYDEVHADPDAAMGQIVARYRALATRCDAVLVVGTDFTDVGAPTELAFNARLAVNLGSPVVLVTTGRDRSADEVLAAVEVARGLLRASHCTVLAVVANRVDRDLVDDVAQRLERSCPVPAYVVPEEPLLTAPSMAQIAAAADLRMLSGDPELLGREALAVLVAAMTMPNVLSRLTEGAVVITAGDRSDVLLGVLMAHRAETFPAVSGVILTGGFDLPETVRRLVQGGGTRLPMLVSEADTYPTAARVTGVRGRLEPGSTRKVDAALSLVGATVDLPGLVDRVRLARSTVVTPLMFEHELADRARGERRRIVLPEGTEPRILQAADVVLRRGIADVVLLGDEVQVRALAADIGADIGAARVIDPYDEELRARFAEEYARLRAHRGMTVELARDVVVDVSYFGTMLVQLGLADGMVSGAAHTTAHTIRPSFEVIRTRPGVSVVSSVFFMCLEDRVLVYGDCAVIPDPTAEQLADIAISSATTAASLGVEPRVAMLSYSTGASGTGADVDKVRTATELVRARRPDLSVDGPIQYDAAVDASVARTKLPDSDVAGRATVFVFPDLNTGNNTYKAVQRSAGAVAIGPVLQGLRKPVNDLSRGATVADIVNTIAITAIQAQQEAVQ